MQAPQDAARLIRFGVFEVDLEAGGLRKRGLRIRLQQQPFQILTLLLERQGRVVTRDELQKLLWPDDTVVEFEHGINAAINRLCGKSCAIPPMSRATSRRCLGVVTGLSCRST